MNGLPLRYSLLFALLLGTGCVHELGAKSHKASRVREEAEEEDDEEQTPGSMRRRMHKTVKEPDPWDINKWFKDERTAEIERNLGVE